MISQDRIRLILIYTVYVQLFSMLQITWPTGLMISGIRPDLALILVIAVGYLYGSRDGAIIGLACGFMLDMQSGRLLGLGMLLLLLIGMVPDLLFQRLGKRPVLLVAVVTIIGAILFHGGILVISSVLSTLDDLPRESLNLITMLTNQVIPIVMMDGLIAIPVTWLIRTWSPYRSRQETFA